MNPRQERGRQLSHDNRIKHVAGSNWTVPSQTGGTGGYIVNAADETCSCPDYEVRRVKCKHLWAVEFTQTVEVGEDGTQVVTESIKVTRKTYRQDWPKYNAAQWELLHDGDNDPHDGDKDVSDRG